MSLLMTPLFLTPSRRRLFIFKTFFLLPKNLRFLPFFAGLRDTDLLRRLTDLVRDWLRLRFLRTIPLIT